MPVNDSIASEMWSRFQICRDFGHLAFLEKADKCEKFTVGDQWRVEDLNALTLARRPALTINKIISTLKAVLGEQINNRSETLFRPAEGGLDETAEALTKVWMQIAQNNQLPWVRSEMFCDGLIRSRGFIDVRLDFSESMRGDVRITNLNSKNVVIDPDAEEYDPDQWADVFVTKWMTPQDISILYSEEDAEMLKAKDGSSFIYGYDSIERVRDRFGGPEALAAYAGTREPNGVRRNIRVLDRQYRKLDKQLHFVDIKTGDLRQVPTAWDRDKIALYLEQMQGTISTVKKLVRRVRWTVTADNVVLHDDWSPYKHFTVVPYFPFFRYGRTAGMVEHLLSPQELLNKVSSQELHVVNTTANSGWKIRSGSLKNMSIEELEQKGAQTGLVLELDDPDNAEKITPNSTPQGLDRISFKAEDHIKSISAVSDSMQGFDREDVAAKAIAYKQQRASSAMSKDVDNLERTDWILARNVLDIVQDYYTEERLIMIIHPDAQHAAEQLTVNQVNPETGEITNDLTMGRYDIIITSTPARASMEDSQFEQAMALREQGVMIPDSVIIESSRLNRKADIIKQMTSAQNSPEAQQAAQLKQRMDAATVAKAEAEVDAAKADTTLKLAKAHRDMTDADSGADGASGEAQEAAVASDIARKDDAHIHAKDLAERKFALEEQERLHKQTLAERDQKLKEDTARAAAFAKTKPATPAPTT